ncbi:phosphotransferase, partial [bacterium]|nr:phosphotransferase [bacterium]
VIDTQNIEGFSIQVKKRPFEGAGELKYQSGHVVAFSGIFGVYQYKPYEYLCGLKQIDIIPVADYYKLFAKIEYKILNQYGYEVSGGERAEFNLLQEINDAYQYDMLLIDEPESSFDNIFLKERVNNIIKDISSKLPVVIVTHNNTVGASIKPDYIVYTNRKIINQKALFEVYYGNPNNKFLCSSNGNQIKNIDITMDCLEAGKGAYEERKRGYEMLGD